MSWIKENKCSIPSNHCDFYILSMLGIALEGAIKLEKSKTTEMNGKDVQFLILRHVKTSVCERLSSSCFFACCLVLTKLLHLFAFFSYPNNQSCKVLGNFQPNILYYAFIYTSVEVDFSAQIEATWNLFVENQITL